ncbi:hypothetical protein [Paraburkholderia caribensis]|uniref:hypothetical protein n=1 Tax=Paraburkholderia caribensis TaxID=75105 RepID=UPI001CC40A02|nr:hypothetical protein [Paraburkholderia caribensis]
MNDLHRIGGELAKNEGACFGRNQAKSGGAIKNLSNVGCIDWILRERAGCKFWRSGRANTIDTALQSSPKAKPDGENLHPRARAHSSS